ncbi:MAG: hypothetical protein RLZZ127_2827 [Planctomycetota bacterium]|jgi:RNA polymerase sigma factor for flagellar operon FliA
MAVSETPRPSRITDAYKAAEGTRTAAEREQEITRHLPLVHSVVERVCAHLPPHVDKEDLFHAGVIGLIDAITRFDPTRDNAFSTYAVLRIRGSVIDELRARDWVPRGARERARGWQQAVNDLLSELGRMPTDEELAARLGVAVGELAAIEAGAAVTTQISLDEPIADETPLGATLARHDDELANPARFLERDDRRHLLAAAFRKLSEQERLVVKLYYFENLLMKEIAAILGVTESRVCQIHGRVMALLRQRLGPHDLF